MPADIMEDKYLYLNREPAWHKLGYVSTEDHTATEALGIIKTYTIEKRPVFVLLNGVSKETGDFALVRSPIAEDPNELVFGYCSKVYNILQPIEIAKSFDKNVNQPVETLGMLGKGEKVFFTWKLPQIDVNGDIVMMFGFVACGYDGKFGASLSLVTTRIVCKNTFAIGINESESNSYAKNGKGRVFAGKHNSGNVGRDLGIWMEHVQNRAMSKVTEAKEKFTQMDNTPIDDTTNLANLLFQIYPDPKNLPTDFPEKLRKEKQDKIDELAEKARKDRIAVENLFGGQGTAINATGWGLFNSVTEYENWTRMTKKPADYSIMMGNRAKTMEHAFAVIDNFVNQK
jgi:hypothetical protein